MKYPLLFLLLSVIAISSCKKDNNQTADISNGTWRLTLFTDSGNDETADFTGYSFTFGNDGSLTVSKSGSTKTGSWSRSSNDFNIDLGEKSDNNKPLGELTDDWHIVSVTANEIKLQDDNDTSDELLNFKKN
ncbi:MAG: lipocalin family protein [Agriterribacter sp.]